MAARNNPADDFEAVDNIVDLSELEEDYMVKNLSIRYRDERIYTYVGNILIAINPYKVINIYGLDMVVKYHKGTMTSLLPHLFAQGNAAYLRMKDELENQVVVISGESGAGKTESTKLLMHFLAMVSNKTSQSLVTEQILEANPLLESFGNARTLINDNSSRFGKYVLLCFSQGVLVGSETTKYLMERSRIVKQLPGERNYHIFYEMLKGLPENVKSELHLLDAKEFAYLNFGKTAVVESRDDLENFQNVQRAFQYQQFSEAETSGIFKVLSAILHLGNVTFRNSENVHRTEGVQLGPETHCSIVSTLLEVPFAGLESILTTRTTETRKERLVIPLTRDQAVDVRDSIAKALYHQVFSWLVEKINQNSKCDKNARDVSTIAILDIFGFEDLTFNSFEQLCINYANESLQWYFNRHIFKIEQEEYAKEDVPWHTIDFQDNKPTVDLISKKPDGIFHLIDEESYFPNGTDQTFLEKCHRKHEHNPQYIKPRMQVPEFGVVHYAGQVTYNVSQFLDKNRETLKSEVLMFLLQSQNSFVTDIFKKEFVVDSKNSVFKSSKHSTGPKSPKCATVSALFDESLRFLLDTMMKCNPWFIRCIKPNNSKTAMLFEDRLVLDQLRATGMLETVRIRKLGYSVRQKFEVFSKRFKLLLPQDVVSPAKNANDASLLFACKSILESQPESYRDSWEIGRTKVFMKESFLGHLVRAELKIITKAVLVFQKYARGLLARESYEKGKKAASTLQAACRGWIAKRHYELLRGGVIAAQAQVRKIFAQKRYKQLKDDDRSRILESNQEQMRKFEEEIKKRRSLILEGVKANKDLSPVDVMEKLSFKVNPNSLEIPAELAYQITHYRALDHSLTRLSNVPPMDFKYNLPPDINSFDFSKYAKVYCPATLSFVPKGASENPILPKASQVERNATSALSDLLVRFLLLDRDTETNRMLSINFIISKCLNNDFLKDEMLLQICSRTLIEKNESILERAWMLLTLCVGCFHPSAVLSNYILNYASHYCTDSLAALCQQNLLRGLNVDEDMDRCHPPCYLEWAAADRKLPMALSFSFYDGMEMRGEVDSWMIAEECMLHLLQQRNLDDGGWSLDLVEDDCCCFLNGTDFIFDGIKQAETDDCALNTTSRFLAYKCNTNPNKSCNLENALAWKPVDMSGIPELTEFVLAPPRSAINPNSFFKFSNRRDSVYAKKMLLPNDLWADHGLSERSPLNARFVASDDRGLPEPIGSPSSSDPLRTPKCLKRTIVDRGDCELEDRSAEISFDVESNANLSAWVEDIFKPALQDDVGLHWVDVRDVVKKLKGGDGEDKPAADPKRRTSSSGLSTRIKLSISRGKNGKAGRGTITEADVEDDREYFDLARLRSSDAKLIGKSFQHHLTYSKVQWRLLARKEIFTRNESISNRTINQLIYLQIMSDLNKRNCIRINEADKDQLRTKMGCRDLDFVTKKNHNDSEKEDIIAVAKQWPNYFSRIYHVSGGKRLDSIKYLGISHSGIRLLKKSTSGGQERLDTVELVRYEEIVDVCIPQQKCLQIHYKGDNYVALYFKQAAQAKNLIEAFCIECEQNSAFVKAVQNYHTNESMLLSFAKGDIIKLTNKNQELEQGWLFGAIHGRVGVFPSEYVVPLAVHEVPTSYITFKTFEIASTPDFSLYNTTRHAELSFSSFEEASREFCMLGFAVDHFRKNESMSSLLKKDVRKASRVWAGKEFLEKILWTKSPIKDSLTCIASDNLNKIAVDTFKCVMEYMHDYPLTRGTSSYSAASMIFSHCRDYPELRDETYCQIIKQLTNNRSPKNNCQQGWRLLFMFTSFFNCSNILRPHVLKYIEERRADYKLAEMCLCNLRQTIKYGGRKGPLEKTEISSITTGRYTMQVVCTVPGNSSIRISVQTSMVVKDAVEQICGGFGVGNAVECSEYIIYIIHGRERSLYPLDDSIYVMDIVTDFVLRKRPCQFLFCRFTWASPFQINADLSHIDLLFAQARPDYLDGFLLRPPPKGPTAMTHVKDTIAKLTFFLMKADSVTDARDKKVIQKYLPRNIVKQFLSTPAEWIGRFSQLNEENRQTSPAQSQRLFLEILSHLPLFGSTFFVISHVSNNRISGKSLLAVNKKGLTFLSEKSMELLWEIPLREVLGVQAMDEKPKHKYLDLKYGNLLVHSMVQLFTENPHPLGLLIDKYIKVTESFRNSSSNTGSSSGKLSSN